MPVGTLLLGEILPSYKHHFTNNINFFFCEISHFGSFTVSFHWTNYNILTCADPSSPSLITKQNSTCLNVKCKGIYTINDGLLVATGTHPIIIKRSGSWIEKNMNELVVGDKLYKVDNTEVEITKIDFDSSETIYEITRVIIGYNYFVNDILVKGGTDA